MSNSIEIYDSTLRDGAQAEGISYSLEDKLLIARRLDLLGVHYMRAVGRTRPIRKTSPFSKMLRSSG